MGLGIYYLYRAGRVIYKGLNSRGTIPTHYQSLREVETYLSSWKGKNVWELIAQIGEPERKLPTGQLHYLMFGVI